MLVLFDDGSKNLLAITPMRSSSGRSGPARRVAFASQRHGLAGYVAGEVRVVAAPPPP